ncbi:MAG: GNAT family N-acetyltransferase [Pirellulaceae bacterium]
MNRPVGDSDCETIHTIPLGKSDILAASEMFARAFHNDPMLAYLIPDSAKRRYLSPRIYRCALRYGVYYGDVVATSANTEGVAVWLPPEAAHGSVPRMLRAGLLSLFFTIGPQFVVRFLSYYQHLERLRQRHTPFRHWYLQLLGVDPEHQGRGHASALLTAMLARAANERLPHCLDTMNRANVAYYERFGFKVVAESVLPKTQIGLWLMAREG